MRAELLAAVLLVAALTCGAFGAESSWSVRETPISTPAARNDDNNVERRTHGDVTCKLPTSCAFYSDVLLVVKLNPVRLLWLDVLQRFYGRGMPNMVFFSSLRKGERHDGDGKYLGVGQYNTTVHLVEDNYGFCDHFTVVRSMEMWPGKYRGYVFLSDDVMLQFWRLTALSKDHVWRQPPVFGERAAKIAYGKDLLAAVAEIRAAGHGSNLDESLLPFAPTSGIYYVPASVAPVFGAVSRVLLKHRTYNEYGTPVALHTVSGKDFTALPGALVWGKRRLRLRNLLTPKDLWQHPVRATGEVFARANLFVYSVRDLAPADALTDDIFTATCLSCATYPSAGRKMKALLHSCVAVPSTRCTETPAAVVAREWPEVGKPETIAGRVVVDAARRLNKCPLELQHEGFWGPAITSFIFEEHYPHLNRSWTHGAILGPFPQCCVERV
jgi:hypothetical protein